MHKIIERVSGQGESIYITIDEKTGRISNVFGLESRKDESGIHFDIMGEEMIRVGRVFGIQFLG